jgi:hypothetical protein
MYTVEKCCVRFKNIYSEFFKCDIGPKQGDRNSPLLFVLFVSDIIQNINTDIDDIFSLNEQKEILII